MTIARRLGAALVLIFAIAITSVSNFTQYLRVCEDMAVTVGKNPTVVSCRPLSVTDTPVVLCVLLMLGLLTPDVTKIKVGGLIEVERKLEEQKEATKDLAQEIKLLSVRMETSATSNVVTGPSYFVTPVGQTWPTDAPIVIDEDQLAKKAQAFFEGQGDDDDGQ